MDLKSLLNNPDDRDHRPRQPSDSSSGPHPPQQPVKRPPPPPLTTPRSSSHPHHGFSQSATPVFERQHSATSYSPGPPYSASSQTPTPISSGPTNFPSPYPRHAPLPSPSSRPISTPTSYFAPGQRPASNHSALGRASSSSPYDQAAAPQPPHSPSASRQNSYHPGITSPLQAQPQTPLAPPPLPRGDSSLSFKDISALPPNHLHHHQSPSASHRPSLHTSRSMSYSASELHSPAPPPHLNGSPTNRRSSIHSLQSNRQSSLSVSPKTVVQDLPVAQAAQPNPATSHQANNTQTPHDNSLPPQPHHANTQAPPDTNLPPHAHQANIQASHDASSLPPPSAKPSHVVSPTPLQPAPELKQRNRPGPDQAMANLVGQPERPDRPAKREAEDELPASGPVKRPRQVKERPIWARPKRGLKPLNGSAPMPHASTNGAGPQPSAQDVPRGPVAGTALGAQEHEPSINNIKPCEEATRQVANLVFQHVMSSADDTPFEIEAKLGILCAPGTHERLQLPVQSEVILDDSAGCTFQSQISVEDHRVMNKYLNELLVESKKQDPYKRPRLPIEYKHSREVDQFFELPAEEQRPLSTQLQQSLREQSHRFKPRVRVTKDQQTGKVTAKIVKSRVADMHVYCPNQRFDWRISINLEQEWAGNLGTLQMAAAADRNKDRLSYSHQWCQIDLTQVKSSDPSRLPSYELEVEMDMRRLREQAKLSQAGNTSSKYEDMIQVFMDNVRVLARH